MDKTNKKQTMLDKIQLYSTLVSPDVLCVSNNVLRDKCSH